MAWPQPTGVPAGSGAMPMAPHYPNLFLAPPFASQPLSSSLNLSGDEAGCTASPFTVEDRMLLRLMYHQQQIIQVQLGTVISWMQMTSNKLAHLERVMRERDGVAPGDAAHGATAPSPTRPDKSHAGRDAALPSHLAATSTREHADAPTASHPTPTTNASTHQSDHHNATSSTKGWQPCVGGSDGVRSCTPPNAEPTGSCSPSVLNHSVDSIAAPWDPRTRGPGPVNSLRSSRGSQLGRQDNPLLGTSLPQPPQRLGAASRRSTAGSHRDSAVSWPQRGGSAHSDSHASTTRPGEERVVPPYRRVAEAAASPDLHRVSALLARRTQQQPGGVEGRRARPAPAPRDAESSTPALLARSGRNTTPPDPPTHHGSPVRHASPVRVDAVGAVRPDVTRPQGLLSSPVTTASAASRRTHAFHEGTRQEPRDELRARGDFALQDYDSLSDGYGSYESKQYLRNNGLL